jgi:hypothetical protein
MAPSSCVLTRWKIRGNPAPKASLKRAVILLMRVNPLGPDYHLKAASLKVITLKIKF